MTKIIPGGSALSFVSGTSDRPLLYRTVDGVLKSAVAEVPDRDALVAPFQSLRFTFAALDREVERVARGMLACGLKPGERIGIWAPNCVEWILTLFGAALNAREALAERWCSRRASSPATTRPC